MTSVSAALIAISDTQPSANAGFVLTADQGLQPIQTSSTIWAQSLGTSNAPSLIHYAPITPIGGNGNSGGAITVADGADVTQGAKADAAYAGSGAGQIAPIQITKAWADISATTDGRFAFPACPDLAMPNTATAIDDSAMQALLPPPLVMTP